MLFRGYTKRQIDRVIKNNKSPRKILRTLKHKRFMCKDAETERYLEEMIDKYTKIYKADAYFEN